MRRPSTGGGGGTAPTSITIEPASTSLRVNQVQQLKATGHYPDNSTLDLTSAVTWTSSDNSKATIISGTPAGGTVTAVAVGAPTITATLGTVSGTMPLTVLPLISIDSMSASSGQPGDTIILTGFGYTNITGVNFNGTPASYRIDSPTQISCTVPNGAMTGPINVVSADHGTATSSTFTVNASGFAFDLTQPSLPAAIAATRTGGVTVYAAADAHTAVAKTAEVYEDRGDGAGGGWWTFPSFQNLIDQPFDHSPGAGWIQSGTPTVTLGATTAPDGTATGDNVDAETPGTNAFIYKGDLTTVANRIHSLWVKDGSPAPTAPGGLDAGHTGQGASFLTGASWRRVRAWSNSVQYHAIWPAGLDIWVGDDNTQTGAVALWGDSEIDDVHDVPLVNGTTAAQTLQLTDGTKLALVIAGGDLSLEGTFISRVGGDGLFSPSDCYVFSMQTPDGLASLRWANATSEWILTVRGVDVANVVMGGWPDGGEIRFRVWYQPSTTGTYALQIFVNGESEAWASGVTTGGGLSAATSLWLGSNVGTSGHMFAQWTSLRKPPASPTFAAEFVVVGDSISAAFQTSIPSASAIYTVPEAHTRPGIYTNAVVGDTIAGQTSKFLASPYAGASSVEAFVCMAGINDVALGHDAATIEADLTALVSAIRTHNPTAKIVLCKLTPCKASITAGQYAVWQAVNAFIIANSLGADAVCTAASDNLNDGSDNIQTKFQFLGVHPNNPGRKQIGAGWRSDLVALGLL